MSCGTSGIASARKYAKTYELTSVTRAYTAKQRPTLTWLRHAPSRYSHAPYRVMCNVQRAACSCFMQKCDTRGTACSMQHPACSMRRVSCGCGYLQQRLQCARHRATHVVRAQGGVALDHDIEQPRFDLSNGLAQLSFKLQRLRPCGDACDGQSQPFVRAAAPATAAAAHPARQSSSWRRRCQHCRAFWRAVAVPACASRSGGGGGAGSRLSPPPPRASGRLRTSCNAHSCHVKHTTFSMQMAPPPRASGRGFELPCACGRHRLPRRQPSHAYDLRITPTECCRCDDAQYLHSRRATTAAVARHRRRRRCVMHSRSVWAVKSAARCAAAGVLDVLTYLHVWWPPASYFPPQS